VPLKFVVADAVWDACTWYGIIGSGAIALQLRCASPVMAGAGFGWPCIRRWGVGQTLGAHSLLAAAFLEPRCAQSAMGRQTQVMQL
jgi:hypothetical protein